jgi:Arc/MetJ-type ribon-helix-helix transcriptional regulator
MADSEKITINMSVVDLGKVDLLVEHGHYSTRTDFIRTAIRSLLERHASDVQQTVLRQSFVIGVLTYGRKALERAKARGERLDIKVIGLLRIADDVSPSLASDVIDSIAVRGVLNASQALRTALADRIH